MAAPAPTLRGVRVLVVDDEPDAVDAVCEFLRLQGADVRYASSAADGLAAAPEFHPDAVVADVSMPAVDGYAFLTRLRALPPAAGGAAPALALTAVAFPEHRQWALAAGFTSFLQKPAAPDAVAQAILALLAPNES